MSDAVTLGELLNLARFTALREGLSRADAEDVASVVVIRYTEAKEVIRSPSAWVRIVARRAAWSVMRGLRRRLPVEDYQLSEVAPGEHLGDLAQERRLDVRAALFSLSEETREIVCLRDVAGEDLGAIAEGTGLSESTVRRRLNAGRASLQRSLQDGAMNPRLRLFVQAG